MGRNSASGILVVHVKGGADVVGVGKVSAIPSSDLRMTGDGDRRKAV